MKKIAVYFSILFLFVLATDLPAGSSAPKDEASQYFVNLAPIESQVKADREIVRYLVRRHYRNQKIDDTLSLELFDRYLADLDRSRSYFLASDIKEFEVYRYKLDDALKTGKLAPAFHIYNRYQQRVVERLLFMLDILDKGLDKMRFDIDETLEIDRQDSPWPADVAELHELWRKRLKGAVLSSKLADKKLPEITKTLSRRYRTQLNKVGQSRSEDAFQVYMNSFTGIFDPHTQYFSPRRSENFDINMSLSFEGIGAILQIDQEYVKIIRLVAAGPAEKTNQLKPADRIVGVRQGDDGEMVDVIGWRIDEVVQLIRGPKGTVVCLEIIPAEAKDDHETKVVRIVRNTVKLEEQSAHKKIMSLKRNDRAYKIGIIDIPTFYVDFKGMQSGAVDYKSTTSDVRRLLKELEAAGVDGIVIDLRDNGGGSLQEANSLTGLFIKQGPTVQIRNADGRVNILRDPDPELVYGGPLVVLVNRLSASASEIFAGAIQDYKRGVIVGGQTFGKGTVQALFGLTQGQLKNTSAKFYRISGESTQHKGVAPDILYPSLYDSEEIGEDSLDSALPWDKIQSLFYRDYSMLDTLLASLLERHEGRMKTDHDYKYIMERVALRKEARLESTVSLNESVRRREYKEAKSRRLKVENELRSARNLPLFEKISDIEEAKPHNIYEADDKAPLEDPALVEGGQILLDVIELSLENVVQR